MARRRYGDLFIGCVEAVKITVLTETDCTHGISNAWNRGDVGAGLFQQGGDLSLQLRDLSFQKLHLLNELSDLESKGISGKAHTEGIGCRCFQLFSFLFS